MTPLRRIALNVYAEAMAQRQACDLELWEAEARVSAQLTRLEASYQKDLHTRLKEEQALNLAITEVRRCLKLRANFVKHLLS
jgi:hypothetical protein